MKNVGHRVKGGYRGAKVRSTFTLSPGRLHPSPFTLHPLQRGYSLVEVLVAITVLLIALVGPLTIAATGLKRSIDSKDYTTAVFLAQEGIEAIVKLREDRALASNDFSQLNATWSSVFNAALRDRCAIGSSNFCGVYIDNNGAVSAASVYRCNSTSCLMKLNRSDRVPFKQRDGSLSGSTDTVYTRQIQLDINDTYARVISTVSWEGRSPGKAVLETYLYNVYYEPAP